MEKYKIYQRELNKILDAGGDASTARSIAAERANEIFDDMVDRGREVAKERSIKD